MFAIGKILDFAGLNKAQKIPDKKIEADTNQEGSNILGLSGAAPWSEVKAFWPEDRIVYRRRSPLQKLMYMSTDDTVMNASDFLTYAVMKKINLKGYHHDNPKIVELVNKSFEHVEGDFYQNARDILAKGIFYGWSVAQTTFDIVKDNYLWGWIVNYNSPEINFTVAKNDRGKEFISKILFFPNYNELSAKNFIIYTHGDMCNVYGYGRGNLVEDYYDLKKKAIRMWDIYLEKFTIPTIIGKTAQSARKLFNSLVKWVYNNIFVIHKDEEVQLLEKNTRNGSMEYKDSIDFQNKMIYRVYFLPPLLESGEKGGSYALGDIHFQMFDLTCSQIAQEFCRNVILGQWIRRLIEYNFGEQESYGEFREDKTQSIDDRMKMMNMFFSAVNMGLLDPVEDNAWMRKDMDFPERQTPVMPVNPLPEEIEPSVEIQEIKSEEKVNV